MSDKGNIIPDEKSDGDGSIILAAQTKTDEHHDNFEDDPVTAPVKTTRLPSNLKLKNNYQPSPSPPPTLRDIGSLENISLPKKPSHVKQKFTIV